MSYEWVLETLGTEIGMGGGEVESKVELSSGGILKGR